MTDITVRRTSRHWWLDRLLPLVVVHCVVTILVLRAQAGFYGRLGSPVLLGYSGLDVALNPSTVAVTVAIAVVSYVMWVWPIVPRRVHLGVPYASAQSAWPRWRVGLTATTALVGLGVAGILLTVHARDQADRALTGRPVFSAFAPYLLRSQPADVVAATGFTPRWSSTDRVLYLGDSHRRFVFRAGHTTYIVPYADIDVVAWPKS